FRGVYDCNVLLGLILENAQLGRAVFRHRTIAIEMVRSEVEPEADRWTKCADRFKLKRAHFNREHIERLPFPRNLGKRFTNIPASDGSLTAGIQHLSQQFCRR